jgi:rhamnulose-1-phosphate aldolase
LKTILSDQLLNEISEIAGYLWERSWAEKNAGNISIRLPEIPEGEIKFLAENKLDQPVPHIGNSYYYITGSGKRMRDVAKSPMDNGMIIRLNGSGNSWAGTNEDIIPTSELPTHLAIHELIASRGSNEKVVMHTHATELIALTQDPDIRSSADLNLIMWGMHPETIVFIPQGIGLIPYILPGTQGIADATLESFKDHKVVVWKKHGVFAIDKTLADAFDSIDIACKSARIWLECKAAGIQPEGFSGEELEELRSLAARFTHT